jgi:EpsD family peptidyl-prolyl cis-trans isomerase
MNPRTVLALSIALALCSCARKAEGQTVAVVNGEEITASELNAELEHASLPPGLTREEARSRVLDSLVNRHLLVQEAKKEGIDKSPEFVTEERRLADALLMQLLVSRQLKTSELPSAQEIQAFETSHPEMFEKREFWTLQQLQYQPPDSPSVAKEIQATKSLDALADVLKKNGIPFNRSTSRIDTSSLPHDAYQQISSAGSGEPFIVTAGERSVASVIANREPAPRVGDEARSFALAKMRNDKAQDLLKARLKNAKETAEIKYQEGFAPPKS